MAEQSRQQVVTGNILQLIIDDKVVGLAQTADGRRSFGTEPVHGIGDFMPREHVQLRYEGTVTVDRFFIRTDDLRSLGLAPLGVDVLDKGVINMLVVDRITKKVIRRYLGMTISDYTETFRANAIAGENATWRYLTCTPTLTDPAGGTI